MIEFENKYLRGKTLGQLIDDIGKPIASPDSVTGEMYRAAVQAKIAELQKDAADTALRWAKVSTISTGIATLIALVALLVAAF